MLFFTPEVLLSEWDGAGAACPAVSPDSVPMRHVPSRVLNDEPCMKNVLSSVPGKVSESFFHLFPPPIKRRVTVQQHLTLLGYAGGFTLLLATWLLHLHQQQHFRDGSKCLPTIPHHNQRRVEQSQRQRLWPAL